MSTFAGNPQRTVTVALIALTLVVGCESTGPAPPSPVQTPSAQGSQTSTPMSRVEPTTTPALPTATAVSPTAAPSSPASGVIAFSSYREGAGNAEIYVMNADGSDQRRLTDDKAVDVASDWSPDGQNLVFMSNRDGNFEIYVMAADGTDQRRLTFDEADDFWPVWSPDGTRIAFSSLRDGNEEIYVMAVPDGTDADHAAPGGRGSDLRRLTNDPAADHDPAWSPDGTRIAFASERDGNAEIYIMEVDGAEPGSGNVRRLTNNPAVDTDPAWSPDGTRIAFVSGPMGRFDIYVMDADGGNVTQLPVGDGDGWAPSWSPDGTQIAFYSYRPGPYRDGKPVAVYVVAVPDGTDADGSDLRQLTDPATHSFHPIWRPAPSVVDVPPGNAPTLDGVLSPGEWDAARQERLSDGSELLLMVDGSSLYLGIRANTRSNITGNIYVQHGDEVRILHSSAALGTATYRKAEDGWQKTQDFVWRCRSTGNNSAAQNERETFLREEGWVASNGRMGTPQELEYRIEMPEGPLRLAVAYRTAAPEMMVWPAGLDDDCTTAFQGGIPETLRFSPEKWATVRVSTAASTPAVTAPEMVLVEAGSFQMGSADGNPNEQPVHEVRITRPFYIGKYEVTFDQFDPFCDVTVGLNNPSDNGWGRGDRPAVNVSWYDAVAYCNWLSEKMGLTPCYSGTGKLIRCDFTVNGYRLPTEAEWEYAARGGHLGQGYAYAGSDAVDAVAWYAGNSSDRTHPVGQKQPNELGLYDMSGNAFEWCWDWYSQSYYASSPADDPEGPLSGTRNYSVNPERVRRGGSKRNDPPHLRVAFRSAVDLMHRGQVNSFRLVRTKSP